MTPSQLSVATQRALQSSIVSTYKTSLRQHGWQTAPKPVVQSSPESEGWQFVSVEATHGGDGGGGGEGDGGGGDGAGAAAGALASQYVTTPPPRLSFHWSAPSIWRAAPHEPQLGTRLVPEPERMVQLTPALQPPVQEAPK